MAAISQTAFWDAFSWMKSCVVWLRFHGSLFLREQSTIASFGSDNSFRVTPFVFTWIREKKEKHKWMNHKNAISYNITQTRQCTLQPCFFNGMNSMFSQMTRTLLALTALAIFAIGMYHTKALFVLKINYCQLSTGHAIKLRNVV